MNPKQGSEIKDLNYYSCDMRAEIFQVTGTIAFNAGRKRRIQMPDPKYKSNSKSRQSSVDVP
jgi:hypothetical protein